MTVDCRFDVAAAAPAAPPAAAAAGAPKERHLSLLMMELLSSVMLQVLFYFNNALCGWCCSPYCWSWCFVCRWSCMVLPSMRTLVLFLSLFLFPCCCRTLPHDARGWALMMMLLLLLLQLAPLMRPWQHLRNRNRCQPPCCSLSDLCWFTLDTPIVHRACAVVRRSGSFRRSRPPAVGRGFHSRSIILMTH